MTPGSEAAIAAGCPCRVIENFWGRGSSPTMGAGRQFMVEVACPIHGYAAWPVQGAADRLLFPWVALAFHPPANGQQADMSHGRLAVRRHSRPPDWSLPFEGSFCDRPVAFFETMVNGRRGMEAWYLARMADGGWPR